MNKFEEIAKEIGNFVNKKNESYGNSFEQTEEFIKMLYPNGIRKDQYFDLLFVIRVFDKLKRIATQKNAFQENPFLDILGLVIRRVENNNPEKI